MIQYEDHAFDDGFSCRRWITDLKGRSIVSVLTAIVESPLFELFFGAFIFLNTFTIAIEVEYEGMDHAYNLGLRRWRAAESWPWAVKTFNVFGLSFGIIFTLEVTLKMCIMGRKFFKSAWNVFDAFVITTFFIEAFAAASIALNPTILRLARLIRLVRVARNFKTIHAFDSLNLLIGSIKASAMILWWSTILLTVVHTMCALFINVMLDAWMRDVSVNEDVRKQTYLYFGTFFRSFVTMFEISMANWVPVCRFLMDNFTGWWGLFMLLHKLTVGFAVMKVITGVFLQSTFACAASDDDLMVIQKDRHAKVFRRKMLDFLSKGDTDKDGHLSLEEFKVVLSDRKLASWLNAMDIEVGDAEILYSMIDNGDGNISLAELVRGVTRMRGSARSVDVCLLLHQISYLHFLVDDLRAEVVRRAPPPVRGPAVQNKA